MKIKPTPQEDRAARERETGRQSDRDKDPRAFIKALTVVTLKDKYLQMFSFVSQLLLNFLASFLIFPHCSLKGMITILLDVNIKLFLVNFYT